MAKPTGRTLVYTLLLCTLLGSVLVPAAGLTQQRWRDQPVQGQEVLAGTYQCSGNIYTDEQPPELATYGYFSATSGITNGFYNTGNSTQDVPADLGAMASICQDHVGNVRTRLPSICTLGETRNEESEWGNGEGVSATFSFSCQGTRDEVVGVIGLLSRLPFLIRLP